MLTLRSIEVRELPFIVQLLVLQLAPYYLGKWLRRAHRPLAEKARGPAHWTAVVAAVATLAVVMAKGDRGILELLHDRAWFAVLAVLVASPIVGWLTGGARSGDRWALAVGANTRELALALVVASLAFPDRGVHTALFGMWVADGVRQLHARVGPAGRAGRRSRARRSRSPQRRDATHVRT
jgi:predicted Na+-dependent transporter